MIEVRDTHMGNSDINKELVSKYKVDNTILQTFFKNAKS